MSESLDAMKTRARSLGVAMRNAGCFDDEDNPYVGIAPMMCAEWAIGFSATAGLIRAVNGWAANREVA